MFLWINAGPAPSSLVLDFAECMSEVTPGLAGAALFGTSLIGGRELRRAVLRTLLAMCLAWVAVSLLRRGFPQPRPAVLKLGWQWLAHGGSAGFPSHHAAGAFACWAGLALSPALRSRRLLVGIGLLVATAIAWSRIYLGVHFPKDVLVGGAIGCLAALLVASVARWLGDALARRAGRASRAAPNGPTPAPVLATRGEP